MSTPTNRQMRRWLMLGLIPPVIALNVYVFGQFFSFFQSLLRIITVSGILAFVLDYAVRLIERLKLSRWRIRHTPAVILVFLLTVAVLTVLGIILVPILVDQVNQVANKLPGWLAANQKQLEFLDRQAQQRNWNLDLQGFIGRTTTQINTQLERQAQDIAKVGVGLAIGTVSSLVDGLIIFILAFYMLLYGEQLWRGLLKFFPPDIAQPFDRSLRLNFHGFFLSQVLLALFMSVALVPFFLWLKVPFALLFILLIGIAELIPLVGPTLGIGIVFLLLLFQNPGLAVQVGFVCMALQQIRDNVIAPKLMGDITGLNPIYVFVVLLMGLQVGGLLGAFLAVPIAGTIKGTIDALLESDRELPLISALAGNETALESPLELSSESPNQSASDQA
jgi:predicted PurR-regulated permease PerM